MDWHEYFFKHVYLAASKSKDPSTHVGAVLVRDNRIIAEGYNGICRGVKDSPERLQRPEKYHWIAHAEANAIYNCAYHGIGTKDSILYTNDTPCADCARAIIQSGVKTVLLHEEWARAIVSRSTKKWQESTERSMAMFKEADVLVAYISRSLGVQTRFDGNFITI